MLAIINSCTVLGMDGYPIEVEVDVSNGLPGFDLVGLPDASVRESKERVRTAINNSGFKFPMRRITVNLAPANIKKEGSLFDLP
ncbi:MAG: magnesium chelatase domain-containing protein, partial [Bacillota bacterium]